MWTRLAFLLILSLFSASARKVLYPGTTNAKWPNKVLGMYVLVADDTVPNYTSNDVWQPELFPYQQTGANVLFLTFINPKDMKVPAAYSNLARRRCVSSGQNASGCVPRDTAVLFSIGGYSYSINPNPWPFLTSTSAAQQMAAEVAQWPQKYGCDGIDIDLETGAGDAANSDTYIIDFVQQLRKLNPSIIISFPVFGYPQVKAEIGMVNAAYTAAGTSLGLIDVIGIMVYQGTQSLQYVKDYANGTHQWDGFPIKVDVPTENILVGIGGQDVDSSIMSLATAVRLGQLRGIMVWYASVINSATKKIAFQYSAYNDASANTATYNSWAKARSSM